MMAVNRRLLPSRSIRNVACMSISPPTEDDGEHGFHAWAFSQSSTLPLVLGRRVYFMPPVPPFCLHSSSPSSQSHSVVQSQLWYSVMVGTEPRRSIRASQCIRDFAFTADEKSR